MKEIILFVIVLSIVMALWRVYTGPTVADRLLSLQVLGTTGVVLLALEKAYTVALSLAILSVVLAIAYRFFVEGQKDVGAF